ncbi:DUF6881 domain-containing protein [Neobacillus ginsengisoli]|uniref:DUF6881 domain-containing protein n=1 Tax=Neobacillus ginsengisoli TaxID=904295 RepID=A0ABT9XRQ8_9BACI|nr:hypothetical protein [Neobacillus ginsengisoli]MDQ0198242.1 hypothetical protein [Neobacillus ginsengisoli]
MEYIYVEWIHNFIDDPVILISEIDENRFEKRKIEIYKNGKIGFAYNNVKVMGTRLSTEPMSSLNDISSDSQFSPKVITKDVFEKYWNENVVPLI